MKSNQELLNALAFVQKTLNAPKDKYNTFGKYYYRSAEGILEAAKPLCIAKGLLLTITDDLVNIGDRNYVKATATVRYIEKKGSYSVSAFACEPSEKKGMDSSQITGAASSYARKYALNGLFCIDDTKDADTDEHKKQVDSAPKQTVVPPAPKFIEQVVIENLLKGLKDAITVSQLNLLKTSAIKLKQNMTQEQINLVGNAIEECKTRIS